MAFPHRYPLKPESECLRLCQNGRSADAKVWRGRPTGLKSKGKKMEGRKEGRKGRNLIRARLPLVFQDERKLNKRARPATEGRTEGRSRTDAHARSTARAPPRSTSRGPSLSPVSSGVGLRHSGSSRIGLRQQYQRWLRYLASSFLLRRY